MASALWNKTGGVLIRRVKAWWFGVQVHDAVEAKPAAAAVDPNQTEDDQAQIDRVALAQLVWGTGYLQPGGSNYILSIVKPFGVNPAMSLLDLTAGLGGGTRQISATFDVYITGLERIAEIAKRGHGMSVDLGLARKVPISAFDPESIELRPNAFDGVVAQHLICSTADKERLIREVFRGLKPRGHFSFVDFVLKEGEIEDPRLDPLRKLERFALLPWRVSQYVDCLTNAGFDCRIAEDQTNLYRSMVLEGWARVLTNVNLKAMPKRQALALLDEAELWVARVNAIESGLFSVYRFYAISNKSA